MPHAIEVLKSQQLEWAGATGREPDARGYVSSLEANLFRPLSSAARAEFDKGKGGELSAEGGAPSKMHALHSSSALVCNVFDYWRGVDDGVIGRALGVRESITEVRLEAELSSGMRGTKPTLDLLLRGSGQQSWGVESKFSEPFAHSRPKEPFRLSYFTPKEGRWDARGLPMCQELAEQLRRSDVHFDYVDAPQLLKHALGLRDPSVNGQLILLWYRVDDVECAALEGEIDLFARSVDESLGFRSLTYQEVFARIAEEAAGHSGHRPYLEYLHSRYFPGIDIGTQGAQS